MDLAALSFPDEMRPPAATDKSSNLWPSCSFYADACVAAGQVIGGL